MGQRGDTIVEVLFAVTVFSLIAVGGLSLMNQGTAMAQRSLEIGLARDQMDAQADALRYVHNAYIANLGQNGAKTTEVWNDIVTKHAVTKAQNFADVATRQKCQLPQSSNADSGNSDGAPFILDTRKLDGQLNGPVILLNQADNIDSTATYAQVRYPPNGTSDPAKPEGIWVQAVHSSSSNNTPGYFDFHIRACWLTPGQSTPVTLGTIVRLYEP